MAGACRTFLLLFVSWWSCAERALVGAARNQPSVQTLQGEVYGGNDSLYRLSSPGYALLTLESLIGDADLYVSSKTNNLTFDLDSHEFQSCTCGVDVVEIPQTVSRPVFIGVYGYFAQPISRYVLTVALY